MALGKTILLLCLMPFAVLVKAQEGNEQNYWQYHQQVISIDSLISYRHFSKALDNYDSLFNSYSFIFLRDYKVAAQLALYINDLPKAIEYIQKGIEAGWQMKKLKKNTFLRKLQKDKIWSSIKKDYSNHRYKYLSRLKQATRLLVKDMFKKDQAKALGALFRLGDKARERYAIKKFAPHSEVQMSLLTGVLKSKGYPGEQLIGNDFWASTIISHHNSISCDYVKKDTLYKSIKPLLLEAICKGQISPFEYALIDDWYKAVVSNRKEIGYGFLNQPSQSSISSTNLLRQKAGLRSVELRNRLVDIANETGMDFYLPDWVDGKIVILDE